MKKIVLLLLCFVFMATAVLGACKGGGNESSAAAASQAGGEGELDSQFRFKDAKFDDVELTVLVRDADYNKIQFVPDDEVKRDAINKAVEERNSIIAQNHGISIAIEAVASPTETLAGVLATNDDEFQIVCDTLQKILPAGSKGDYIDLSNEINLQASWWDQNAIDYLSFTDKIYFVAGDPIITDDEHTYLLLYNKDLYNSNAELYGEFGNLYDLVLEGKWTYDALVAMSKYVSKPDTEGMYGKAGSSFGLVSEGYGTSMMIAGAGIQSITKDSDGTLSVSVASSKAIAVFEDVFEFIVDETVTFLLDKFDDGWNVAVDIFKDQRGLFYENTVSGITNLRDMNLDFEVGVVPIPKYNEDQESYYSGVNIYHFTVLGVPRTNVEYFEETMCLLDCLGYYGSRDTEKHVGDLSYAYYETTLKKQSFDEDDDEKMLDIVFNNRLFDLGYAFEWGGVILLYPDAMRAGYESKTHSIMSKYEEKSSAIETAMQASIEAYQSLS